MLDELEISSLGPIHHAIMRPGIGMTAITGETGAGKSMLLNAIQLISGQAARSERVSASADQAWVQGIFTVAGNAGAIEIAEQAGAECEDDLAYISRLIPAEGRSRAVLNGRSVPRSVLTDISSSLVTIHGQAEQLRIASTARQREFLDQYAQNDVLRAQFTADFSAYHDAQATLMRVIDQEASSRAQADYLRESIARIDNINPHMDEDIQLRNQREQIENAADIAIAANSAITALDPSQVADEADIISVTDAIDRAIHALQSVRGINLFDSLISRLESVNTEIQDIVFSLSQNNNDDDVNPADLDTINSRIHELDDLMKRWGPTLHDVLEWRKKAEFDIEDLDASPERIEQLTQARDKALAKALEDAYKLSESRVDAAQKLGAAVTAELKSLAMAGAKLDVVVEQHDSSHLDSHGLDTISFLFTPYPSSPQLPMSKSASGGELSRLMLALELVAFESRQDQNNSAAPKDNGSMTLTSPQQSMTLIFDEIDAGVGGKSAAELGKRLARLAQGAQVIVVTHLPQVASWAQTQYVVAKESISDAAGENTQTTVSEVTEQERVKEIARMLSGSESETSLEHARELLASSVL